jgi:hypothetical protein
MIFALNNLSRNSSVHICVPLIDMHVSPGWEGARIVLSSTGDMQTFHTVFLLLKFILWGAQWLRKGQSPCPELLVIWLFIICLELQRDIWYTSTSCSSRHIIKRSGQRSRHVMSRFAFTMVFRTWQEKKSLPIPPVQLPHNHRGC